MLSPFRRAITQYDLIQDGDKIAVGVSGGKDSLTLLALLNAYKRFSPQKFDLIAVTIDMGFDGSDYSAIAKWCADNNIPYILEKTDIAEIIFDVRQETNPCSLCSKMRRGALNGVITAQGCNKLALGHHRDDVTETFFLSLLFEGRLNTFAPKSFMTRSKITLIRPLVFTTENDIAAYARDAELPVAHNPCPADKHTQRQYMKDLIKKIQEDIPFAPERIAAAISNPDRYNLWDDLEKKYQSQKSIDESKNDLCNLETPHKIIKNQRIQ